MAEESVSGRSLGWRQALPAVAIDSRYPALALTVLVFLTVVLVYHITSVGPTAFNQPVRLADAILHGRVDIANGAELTYLEWAPYQGKYYPVDPPMGAFVILPGVILFGLSISQTFVSAVIGGITAMVVFWLMRGLTEKLHVQLFFTALFAFGTTAWWAAISGANWHYAHTVAILFLFLAVHQTLVGKRPLTAGLFLGAAYLSRLTPILAFPFFIIMFSDQWLPRDEGKSLLERVNLKPLLLFGSGVAVFVLISFVYNYLQFETPLPASRHYYFEQFQPRPDVLAHGLWDIRHLERHTPHFFEDIAIFQSNAPYVVPSLFGVAIWVVTPPFLYALFAGIRSRLVIVAGAIMLAASLASFIITARGLGYEGKLDPPFAIEYLPFVFLVAASLFFAIRTANKLVLACWSAVIPIAMVHLTYFAPPPQFGYQYALDYYPFLFLLVWVVIGDRLRWHHLLLTAAAVGVNLWGVLWLFEFQATQFLGLQWAKP